MQSLRPRTALALGATLAVAAMGLASCALSDRPRRAATREPAAPEPPDDASADPEGRPLQIPRDANPAIVQSDPVDTGSTACPGVRVLRVDRHHTAAPPGAPALMPRYWGRDDLGRVMPMRDVLACELRALRWVEHPIPEGTNLILWHGPLAFAPDDDCDWREPVRVDPAPRGARRVTAVERCRRRAGSTGEHTVVLEVSADYQLTVR